MITRILLALVMFMVVACERSDREHIPASEKFLGVIPYEQFKPVPYRKRPFDYMPYGEDSYSQGYQAGCKAMTSIVAEGLYRLQDPKIDAYKLSSDPWYLRGYSDAETACTFNFDWELH